MKIVDVWQQGSDILAYCTGEEINTDFSCKRIVSGDESYEVLGIDICVSIAGAVSAVLKLKAANVEDVIPGEFRILN
jgi:hypothetical protein